MLYSKKQCSEYLQPQFQSLWHWRAHLRYAKNTTKWRKNMPEVKIVVCCGKHLFNFFLNIKRQSCCMLTLVSIFYVYATINYLLNAICSNWQIRHCDFILRNQKIRTDIFKSLKRILNSFEYNDMFVNCNWVVIRWHIYTHKIHRTTQSTQTIHRTTQFTN